MENSVPDITESTVVGTPTLLTQEEVLNIEKTPETAETFQHILDNLREWQVAPIQVIQGGKGLPNLGVEDIRDTSDRPFAVILTESLVDRTRYIYKVRTSDDEARINGHNEIQFLENVAPLIQAGLPVDLKEKCLFPKLYRSKNVGHTSLLEEYFEGEKSGGIHRGEPDILDQQDVISVAKFIKAIQGVGLSNIQAAAPDIQLLPVNVFDKYKESLNKREKLLREALGDESFQQLLQLLSANTTFLQQGEFNFAAGDINPSNIIKLKNGQLGMIDWEKVCMTNSPAFDYGFMLTTLSKNPDLQQAYLDQVLALNQDVPNFQELLRLDFIFYRGAGELTYWYSKQKSALTLEDKEECKQAITVLRKLHDDAISKKGIWEGKQTNDTSMPNGRQ